MSLNQFSKPFQYMNVNLKVTRRLLSRRSEVNRPEFGQIIDAYSLSTQTFRNTMLTHPPGGCVLNHVSLLLVQSFFPGI